MMTGDPSLPRESAGVKLLKRIWGALPVIVIVLIVFILGAAIKSKTEKLEALKTGLDALKGQQAAIADINKVVGIVRQAKDANDAAQKLAAELNISEDAAKAAVHMTLGTLAEFQQEKLTRQIAYVERQIAEHKLEVEVQSPEINVVSLKLAPMAVSDRINLPGVVEPWVKFNIVSEVRGKVEKKMIEKGRPVKQGEVIAVIDTKDYEIALQAARASYDTALASKNRLEKLYKEQLASRSQLDDIIAQVEVYNAQRESAELNLSRCTIVSPISGLINNLFIEEGEYVKVSDPIAEIMQVDRVKVNVGIPESDVNDIGNVQEFEVEFDALNGRIFRASRFFLSKASDAQARLYSLELALDNPDGEILPDMFARVNIIKKEVPDALAVPLYSVITLNDEKTVYVVNDGVVHARKVETGIQEGWMIQITEGLAPDDEVIVVGHRRVSDGQKVNVIRTLKHLEELQN